MTDKIERCNRYAEQLARLIRFETISYEEKRDPEKYAKFHELLKQEFPALFAACEYENINGSLLLKWKGAEGSGKEPVLFMNHMDTVDLQGEWEYPPLSGQIAEGKVWGRGTLDNKGGLWGMLCAANELAAEGFVPGCDIYFESSCSEEINATDCGAFPVAQTLKERGVHFSMILDEGGMITDEPVSGVHKNFAMVGLGERGCTSIKFTAKGKGGHASTPDKNSPLVQLGKFMAEVDRSRIFKVELANAIKEMLRRFAPFVDGPISKVYGNPEKFDAVLKAVMPMSSPTAKALVQTTIAFTMAEGSNGLNVIPAEAYVIGNMRISHHQGFKSSLEAIGKVAKKYGLEMTVLEEPNESKLSDFNSKAFKLIEDAVAACFDSVLTAPYIMTGCSDLRYLDFLGDNCFHFVPFVISKEQMESIHGQNECVDVATLAPAVDFYKMLMKGAANV